MAVVRAEGVPFGSAALTAENPDGFRKPDAPQQTLIAIQKSNGQVGEGPEKWKLSCWRGLADPGCLDRTSGIWPHSVASRPAGPSGAQIGRHLSRRSKAIRACVSTLRARFRAPSIIFQDPQVGPWLRFFVSGRHAHHRSEGPFTGSRPSPPSLQGFPRSRGLRDASPHFRPGSRRSLFLTGSVPREPGPKARDSHPFHLVHWVAPARRAARVAPQDRSS